jgi:hypothetical protein
MTSEPADLPIHLYQIFYSEATQQTLEEGYEPLDNLANERPDWYEYWPIRRFLLNETLDEQAFYGFFSPKFGAKTRISHSEAVRFIRDHAHLADVIVFSPQPDMGAFFLNVYEQAETFDPGMIDAYSTFLTQIGREVALRQLVMDSRQVSFANYFVARPAFWREWLIINEAMFALCEDADSALGRELCLPTSYPGEVQRKVFLQERVTSLLLVTQPAWRSVAYNPFGMCWSVSRFNEYPTEAVISDALKLAYREQKFPEYLHAFRRIRERFCAGEKFG